MPITYFCTHCNYKAGGKNRYERHIESLAHQIAVNGVVCCGIKYHKKHTWVNHKKSRKHHERKQLGLLNMDDPNVINEPVLVEDDVNKEIVLMDQKKYVIKKISKNVENTEKIKPVEPTEATVTLTLPTETYMATISTVDEFDTEDSELSQGIIPKTDGFDTEDSEQEPHPELDKYEPDNGRRGKF